MIHKINSGDKEKKRIVFLDWELCLITDPYYDLGVHLHKMRYEPHQEEIFLSEYLQKPPKSKEYKAALREIKIYEEVEIIRTVLVDIQRASLDFSVANTEARKEIITSHYFHKFKKSFGLFGMIPSVEKSDIRNMLVQIRSELF